MKIGVLALLGFILSIPAANWLIGNVGTTCVPNGPCLIPVGFGFDAPSGVLMIGAALVLRDVVQERFGATGAFAAILAGTILSALFAAPALVIASAAAFLLSELADLAVYTPLRKRHLYAALALSGLAGAVIDSSIFQMLAFGSLEFVAGQTLGKLWMTLAAVPVLWTMTRRLA